MTVYLIIPLCAILLAMLLTLMCAIFQKTLYDKILAVNVLGTITVLFITVYQFAVGRPDFLDIALAYALINFITTIAILKFFEYRDFSHSGEVGEEI